MKINEIVLTLSIVLALIAIVYSRHHWNRRKALQRIRRIVHLWSLSDGSVKALDLYAEARELWRYYGIIPEDFGYDDWVSVQAAATDSLGRYIETMNLIYAEEYASCLKLQEKIRSKRAADEEVEEMSAISRAVVKLGAMLSVTRETLIDFRESHKAPLFS